MIVALAGLSLPACNKEMDTPEEVVPSEDVHAYTIAIAGETKSHFNDDHMTWDEGDLIGWFINEEEGDCSDIDCTADPRTFEIISSTALPANSTIYAFAPFYTIYFSDYTLTKTAAPLSIPVNQDGLIYDAMPMVSLPIVIADATAANTDKPIAEASFINLGAVIEYNVYTTNSDFASEKVESVQFTATSPIAGDFTVDLTAVSESAIPSPSGLDRNTVPVKPTASRSIRSLPPAPGRVQLRSLRMLPFISIPSPTRNSTAQRSNPSTWTWAAQMPRARTRIIFMNPF